MEHNHIAATPLDQITNIFLCAVSEVGNIPSIMLVLFLQCVLTGRSFLRLSATKSNLPLVDFGTTPGGLALMNMEKRCMGACTGRCKNTGYMWENLLSGTCGRTDLRSALSSLTTHLRSTMENPSHPFLPGCCCCCRRRSHRRCRRCRRRRCCCKNVCLSVKNQPSFS